MCPSLAVRVLTKLGMCWFPSTDSHFLGIRGVSPFLQFFSSFFKKNYFMRKLRSLFQRDKNTKTLKNVPERATYSFPAPTLFPGQQISSV